MNFSLRRSAQLSWLLLAVLGARTPPVAANPEDTVKPATSPEETRTGLDADGRLEIGDTTA
jgi:hypothetical protein